MTYFALKIYAMVFMLIDHIGYFLMRNDIKMRVIGRMAFPLFCFLLVNGYHHTLNKRKYLLRMILFAFASELIYDFVLMGGFNIEKQNIFFTLSLGLVAMMATDAVRKHIDSGIKGKWQIILECICLLAIPCIFCSLNQYICAEYGWYGMMMIYLLYITYGTDKISKILMSVALIVPNVLKYAMEGNELQCYSVLAITYIILFVDRKVSVPKWARLLCYVFYPAHLLVLWYIKMYGI